MAPQLRISGFGACCEIVRFYNAEVLLLQRCRVQTKPEWVGLVAKIAARYIIYGMADGTRVGPSYTYVKTYVYTYMHMYIYMYMYIMYIYIYTYMYAYSRKES